MNNSPIYSMCVLNKIRSMPNATPRQIYNHYYTEIQKKQLEEINILKHPLDLIDKAIRKINVVTDDPVEKAYIIKIYIKFMYDNKTTLAFVVHQL